MAREHYLDATRRGAGAARAAPARARGVAPAATGSFALDAGARRGGFGAGRRTELRATSSCYTTLDGRAQRAAERGRGRQADAIERSAGAGRSTVATRCRARWSPLDPRTGEHPRPGRRAALRAARVQPRAGRAAAAGLRVQALRLRRRARRRLHAGRRGEDTPVEIADGGRIWRPANFDGEYAGPLTLRRALMRSANAATVRLGRGGRRAARGRARPPSAGIRSPLAAVPVARARRGRGDAARARRRLRAVRQRRVSGSEPSLVRRIDAADGTVLWRAPDRTRRERVLGAAEAFQITVHARVGGGRRHRRWCANCGVRGPRGREDRHDQQRHRRLVRGLHADRGGRGLVRLRRAAADRTRPPRAAGSRRRRGRRST